MDGEANAHASDDWRESGVSLSVGTRAGVYVNGLGMFRVGRQVRVSYLQTLSKPDPT